MRLENFRTKEGANSTEAALAIRLLLKTHLLKHLFYTMRTMELLWSSCKIVSIR